MESTSPWGLHGDSPWSPCGLLEMLNVVLLKSMESPQSPRGLHGDSWKVLMESSWSLWEHVGECKVLKNSVSITNWICKLILPQYCYYVRRRQKTKSPTSFTSSMTQGRQRTIFQVTCPLASTCIPVFRGWGSPNGNFVMYVQRCSFQHIY
jgi:hypothetical protein